MKEPTLVIMAAGMGSRFGGLKQIEPVGNGGEIILDFSLYDAMMAGFKKAVFVIKRENEQDFRGLIDDRAGKYMEIQYAYQELSDLPKGYHVPEGRVKPWGTAHAVLAARKLVDGPIAVINADDYYGPGAFQSIYEFLEKAEDDWQETDGAKYHYCMVGYQLENTLTENGFVSRGVCKTSPEGLLTEITERTKIQWQDDKIVYEENGRWEELERGATVSMNFWGFTPSMLREMENRFPAFLDGTLKENPMKGEYFLPGVVDQLIHENKADVKVLKSMDRWYGVTYKEDKQSVVDALQSMKDKGEYPDKLWK
ncbi:MAG: nucleotidyltransferase [Firmicutes bacterium]|nr:nucleotidyltransferase [Bacillota bacterium]